MFEHPFSSWLLFSTLGELTSYALMFLLDGITFIYPRCQAGVHFYENGKHPTNLGW